MASISWIVAQKGLLKAQNRLSVAQHGLLVAPIAVIVAQHGLLVAQTSFIVAQHGLLVAQLNLTMTPNEMACWWLPKKILSWLREARVALRLYPQRLVNDSFLIQSSKYHCTAASAASVCRAKICIYFSSNLDIVKKYSKSKQMD